MSRSVTVTVTVVLHTLLVTCDACLVTEEVLAHDHDRCSEDEVLLRTAHQWSDAHPAAVRPLLRVGHHTMRTGG